MTKKKPKDPKKYTDRKQPILTETGAHLDPTMLEKEERRQRVANYFKDAGTTLSTLGTQLRMPTEEELERARSGLMGQAEMLSKGITWSMIDALTGKALGRLPGAIKSLRKRGSSNVYNSGPIINELESGVTKKLSQKQYITTGYLYDPYEDIAVQEGDRFVREWFNHPAKIEQFGKERGLDIARRASRVNTKYVKPDLINNSLGQSASLAFDPDDYYSVVSEEIRKYPSKYKTSISAHEATHASTLGGRLLSKEEIDMIENKLLNRVEYVENIYPNSHSSLSNDQIKGMYKMHDYLSKPTEIHARIMQLRQLAGVAPGEEFTGLHLKKALKKVEGAKAIGHKDFGHFKRLSSMLKGGNKDIIKLANSLRAVPGVAIGLNNKEEMAKGGWVQKAAASVKRRGTEGKCGPNCDRPGCTGRALALCHAFHTIARNRKKKADGGEVENMSFGGIAKETIGGGAKGGLTGMGLPGVIMGAGLGLVRGLIDHVHEKKEEDEDQISPMAASARARQAFQSSYNPYNVTFPEGGMIPEANVELEREEVFQTPEGEIGQVNAPDHSQGGIDMYLQPGTRVFSDRLQTTTGKTFAEEAEKIKKQIAKYEKMLN